MTITRPGWNPGRSALLLSLIGCVAAACGKPSPAPPSTFDSPRDVTILRWCEHVMSDGTATAERWPGMCEASDGERLDAGVFSTGEFAFALVANSGNRFVQVVRIDTTNAGYIDHDPSIPGNTGIQVPDGPVEIELLAFPTLALVASERESALSVIDVPRGRAIDLRVADSVGAEGRDIGKRLALDEPLGALRTVVVSEDGGACEQDCVAAAVGTQPISNRLVSWTIDATCDGSRDIATASCSLDATIVEGPSIALPGSPLDVAVRADGRAWVAMRGERALAVVGLFGPALQDECGGTPCIISRLPVGASCADGVDDDGDGLVDADDPQCFGPNDNEAGTLIVGIDGVGAFSACTDGVDGDGDGLVDAADPDCLDAGDRVEGPGYDATDFLPLLIAADGSGEGSGEGSGDDGSGEGSGDEGSGEGDSYDMRVPSQFTTASASEIPECNDGVDNDGDGLSDLDDPGCYHTNDESESDPGFPHVPSVTLTDEGDLVTAVERVTGQLYIYDADRLALLEANDLDPLHTTRGVNMLGAFPGPALADPVRAVASFATSAEPARATGDGATHIERVERRIHVATTSGYAETIIVDNTLTSYDGDPDTGDATVVDTGYDLILEPRDRNATYANVSGVDCTIPGTLDPFIGSLGGCDADELPAPIVVGEVDGDCPADPTADNRNDAPYFERTGDCFGTLPTRTVHVANELPDDGEAMPDTAFSETIVSDDYATLGGGWEVVWEGVINGSSRDDILLDGEFAGQERGWLRFAGTEPCSDPDDAQVCGSGLFDRDECPELYSLCFDARDGAPALGSAGVCGLGVDICDLCPEACASAIDVCALGVLPGDILELDRVDVDGAECAAFAEVGSGTDEDSLPRLEYEVCAITETEIEVAAFGTGCDGVREAAYTTVGTLPPSSCLTGPLDGRVRAAGWLVRVDQRVGPSPYHAVAGQCAFADDAARNVMRARTDERFTSPLGLTFEIAPPAAPISAPSVASGETLGPLYPRDFAIVFDVDREFTFRSERSRELLMGPATSAMAVSDVWLRQDSRPSRRIAIVDESQSFLWLFNSYSYGSANEPLP